MSFDETSFIKEVLNNYINYNNYNQDLSIIYDNHFNNIIKKYNITDIFNLYIKEIDIEDAKYRYGNNYINIKLNLILYSKIINYIYDKKINIMSQNI